MDIDKDIAIKKLGILKHIFCTLLRTDGRLDMQTLLIFPSNTKTPLKII